MLLLQLDNLSIRGSGTLYFPPREKRAAGSAERVLELIKMIMLISRERGVWKIRDCIASAWRSQCGAV